MTLGRAPQHRLFVAVIGAILAALVCAGAVAAPPGPGGVVKTFYAEIYYPADKALAEFTERTSFNSPALGMSNPRIETMAADNVDRIVFRVKTLLDMYPAELSFSIHIYETYSELSAVYRNIGMIGTPPVAFYSHGMAGIYLTTERLNAGILAHEIAHAVINAYFVTPPPAKMQEILSQYVDRHLNDSTAPARR